jgi:hypothetical protein
VSLKAKKKRNATSPFFLKDTVFQLYINKQGDRVAFNKRLINLGGRLLGAPRRLLGVKKLIGCDTVVRAVYSVDILN